jgi:hypothetical protein
MTPTCKSVRERNLRGLTSDFADALRRRLDPARRSRRIALRSVLADQCERAFESSKALAATRRYFFAFLLLAVLRAVFFAADLVDFFAFFAILPS